MRTVVIALATIAVLTAPAYSQSQGNTAKRSGSEKQQSAEPKEQKKKPVEPPPAIVKPVNAEAAKPRTAKRAAPSAWSENCLHRKYRLVDGARRWYCKRWK